MKNSGIEWIGEIPDSWETKTIKQLLIERIEKNSEYQTSTILSLSAKNGVTLYDGEHHAGNRPREDLSDYKVVYPSDIVANSMNILSGSVGLSAYKGCVSPVYYIYYPRSNDNIEFLHYVFQCKQFQLSLRGLGNGILIKESEKGNLNTIRMRIPAQKLAAQVFPYCSSETQQKIVDFLNEKLSQVDELIANLQAQIEKLKEYKESVITEAVTKGLDKSAPMKNSGIEWIGEIPDGWGIRRAKFLADSFLKGNGITKEDIVVDGDSPCVRYGEIYTKYDISFDVCATRTNLDKVSSPQYFEYGNILFVCTGELVEEIGKNIVYLGKDNCLAGGDIIVMKHSQNPLYLSFALNSYISQCQKSCNKAKLKVVHISAGDIGNVYIAIPSIEEQKKIALYLKNKCDGINRIIAIKQEKIEKLQEYKKSLIYEYVTGKKEVV